MRETELDTRSLKVFVYTQQEHNTFGKLLRAVRDSWNMSQESFGKILGVSKQRVSNFENDLRSPKINTIISVAGRLKMPLRIIFGEQERVIQSDGVYRTEILTEEAYRIACAYMNARKKCQNIVRYTLEVPFIDQETENIRPSSEGVPH